MSRSNFIGCCRPEVGVKNCERYPNTQNWLRKAAEIYADIQVWMLVVQSTDPGVQKLMPAIHFQSLCAAFPEAIFHVPCFLQDGWLQNLKMFSILYYHVAGKAVLGSILFNLLGKVVSVDFPQFQSNTLHFSFYLHNAPFHSVICNLSSSVFS